MFFAFFSLFATSNYTLSLSLSYYLQIQVAITDHIVPSSSPEKTKIFLFEFFFLTRLHPISRRIIWTVRKMRTILFFFSLKIRLNVGKKIYQSVQENFITSPIFFLILKWIVKFFPHSKATFDLKKFFLKKLPFPHYFTHF